MLRRLLPADADAVLRLRREALEREPLAFSSSPTDDRVQAGGVLEQYLAHRTKAIFGAFEPDLIGMAGIAQEEGAKSRPKARLWGVYVTPSHRGSGIGRAAQALYVQLGFMTWGTEPAAMWVGEECVAEHHMVRALRPGALQE
jgi:GNAT superfamily N-acetyltransferase